MKLEINPESLKSAIKSVSPCLANRTTLPILGNIRITATEDNRIELAATDMDILIQSTISGTVHSPGSFTLPGKRLASIADSVSGMISMNLDPEKGAVSMKSGNGSFTLLGLPVAEFPVDPVIEKGFRLSCPGDALAKCLAMVAFAASDDETRYVINGVLISLRGETMTLVATDGRRLSSANLTIPGMSVPDVDFIIPSPAVDRLMPLLTSEEVVISGSGKIAKFSTASHCLTTKLIEGSYPNWRQAIPGKAQYSIAINRETLLSSARRVATMSDPKMQKMTLKISAGALNLYSSGAEIGDATETMDVDYGGPEMSLTINPVFFQDPLKKLTHDEVIINLINETSPATFETKDKDWFYVMMPMRSA